jgi:WD40 repeat protein
MLKMVMSALQGEEGGERVVVPAPEPEPLTTNASMYQLSPGPERPISPISSFRKDADDSSSEDGLGDEPPETSEQTDLNLPEFPEGRPTNDFMRPEGPTALPLGTEEDHHSGPANNISTETWDERIQREIEAAKRAAAAAMAHQNPAMLSFAAAGEPDLLQTDESMASFDSYEFLQNFAANDAISKQRLLSFDSKEDIDLAYSRSSTSNLRVEQSILQESNNNLHQLCLQTAQASHEASGHVAPMKQLTEHCSLDLKMVQNDQTSALSPTSVDTCEAYAVSCQVSPQEPTQEHRVQTLESSRSNESLQSMEHKSKDITSPDNSGSILGMALLPESPVKWYRKSHLVLENDGTGEGVIVVANMPNSFVYNDSENKMSYKPVSLLDDEQSSCSERPRKLLATGRLQRQTSEPSRKPPTIGTHDVTTAQSRSLSIHPNNSICKVSEKTNEREDPLASHTDRHARFTENKPSHRTEDDSVDEELRDCLSATESEVASVDGLPSRLHERWLLGESPREKMLQSLDGIHSVPKRTEQEAPLASSTPPRLLHGGNVRDEPGGEDDTTYDGPFFEACLNFWGSNDRPKCGSKGHWRTSSWKQQHDVPLAILDCANIINQEERVPAQASRVQTSLVRVASDYPNPSYAETLLHTEVDPRMQDWIASQYAFRDRPPRDGSYHLGKSRTVIVHEIYRGNWTWCTAWSPDGALLAVATDNHHIAVVDTTSSTVWRVRHDKKIRGPQKNNTTHSIRSIAWGRNYIAIGGTGNAVSILAPTEPYDILHTIKATGFVGCLHWRGESNVLAIGSRLDFVMIVRIRETDENSTVHGGKQLESDILHRIEYKYWVNSVAFSPDGSCLAVGDSGGIVSVYDYEESEKVVETHMITWFKRKDSILSIEWSPEGKWLYAGGEDRSVTVIDTSFWEIVHRIGQDR